MEYRRTGAAIVISHLLRSWYTPEVSETIRVELSEFRAEVNKVEGTLRQTSLVLEHCSNYSSFLTYVLKLLAISELLLLLWIGYLLLSKPSTTVVSQIPALEGITSPQSSASGETSRSAVSEQTLRQVRSGPLRPSDLRKNQ